MKIGKIDNSGFYRPLRYFLLFICFTVSFSFWGPRIYYDYDKVSVFIYISAFLILFTWGYRKGISKRIIPRIIKTNKSQLIKNVPFLKACIVLALLTSILNIISLIIDGKLNLSISSIGQNYVDYYAAHNATKGTYTIQTIIFFVMGFPKIVTLVLGVYFFGKIGKLYKYGVVGVIVLTILTNTISSGNQKSLGDIIIYSFVALIVKSFEFTPARRKKFYLQLSGVIVLFIVFISIVQFQRFSALGFSSMDINQNMNSRTSFDFNHPFFKIFGNELGLGLATFITGYLSGGYYGLSLCLRMNFVWTYGIGNSYSVTLFFEKFFGATIFDHTYLMRMENTYGWGALADWNTIFPWLASDFTFIGSLFLFIPIGYIYALSWKEIVMYRNPISLLMFAMLTVCLIFVPANNQLLHGVDAFIATVITFFVWKTQHRKYNIIPLKSPVLIELD